MQLIERKKGGFKSLLFTANLSGVNKVYTDVEEIYFVIKKRLADEDSAAIMTKTKTLNGITIDAESKIVVPWATDEYDSFTIGTEYFLGLFLKFIGDPVADEDVEQEFKIKIIQDFLHDS